MYHIINACGTNSEQLCVNSKHPPKYHKKLAPHSGAAPETSCAELRWRWSTLFRNRGTRCGEEWNDVGALSVSLSEKKKSIPA